MQVILAEKPSVAKDIAAVLGAKTKKDGYFEGNGYTVTYAFGHLVQFAEPEEMDPDWGKPWRLEQLPMIPDRWEYRVAKGAHKQFALIKKLFNDPETQSIVCATDAGREGEYIFRLIYKLSGSKKPVQRLWISSLTADAIKEGFRKLRPASDFTNLARAAAARAQADWLVGLNFTRAYSVASKQFCTIGRVQTPTLSLLVERQREIDNFKPTQFFEVLATLDPGFTAAYVSKDDETRILDRAQAGSIVDKIKQVQNATVVSVETTEKKSKAPPLYDLLTLQKDANRLFGFTAQQTLDIAQSLYEEYKLASYPRTESRHISTDMVEELPKILNALLPGQAKNVLDALDKEGLVPGRITAALIRPMLGKTYVDDTKLTDHHAIIPTNKLPLADLPEKQKQLYQLILARFFAIFLPPERRDETIARFLIAELTFRAKGAIIKDPGWTVIEQKAKTKDQDQDDLANQEKQKLPPLKSGQQIRKLKEELKTGKTSAPKPFDDASLLTAMKNAGQQIDDDDLANYMKQSGLGTPATRAAIIERLLQTGYIERQKKALVPTEKGKALIANVHARLKDVRLTALWEQQLAQVQDGELPVADFENSIIDLVEDLLPEITQNSKQLQQAVAVQAESIGDCPQCSKGEIHETSKGANCSRWKEGCTFYVWREQYGKKLTDAQLKSLVVKGKTPLLKGFKKKDGTGTYDARLVLTDDFKVKLSFEKA